MAEGRADTGDSATPKLVVAAPIKPAKASTTVGTERKEKRLRDVKEGTMAR